MKIKFLKDILVAGSHCATGTVGEVALNIATQLIASGDAIAHKEIEIEKAQFEPAKVEQAIIRASKKAHKSK